MPRETSGGRSCSVPCTETGAERHGQGPWGRGALWNRERVLWARQRVLVVDGGEVVVAVTVKPLKATEAGRW